MMIKGEMEVGGVGADRNFPRFSKSGSLTLATSQEIARAAMGLGRYWGVEEWEEHFGYPFTKEQLQAIEKAPWDSEELQSICRTHFLHLGVPPPSLERPGLTISNWRQMPDVEIKIGDSLKDNPAIVSETLSLRWYLTQLGSVKGSANLKYSQQLQLLHSNEEPPSAIEVVQAFLLYEKLNLEPANLECFLRTRNLIIGGGVVSVGYIKTWNSDDPAMEPLWVMGGSQNIACTGGGIGSSRKSFKDLPLKIFKE